MVSMSNMGVAVSRLMAENAIESDQTNRLIHRSGAAASEAEIDEKNKEKEIANSVRGAAAYVEMASSAVNVARSSAKVGEAANDYAQYRSTEPGLTSGTEHARSGNTATQAQGMQEVLNTRLGEGQTVRERFGERKTSALMRSDLGQQPGETRDGWNTRAGARLREAGFSEAEVNQIYNKAKDGSFSTEDAVNFMWENRKTPEQQKSEVVRDKIIDAIQGQSVAFINRNLGEVGKKAQAQGKRSGEEAGKLTEISERALDLSVEHNKKLGDLDLEGVRQRRGSGGAKK
jgi:hypothetical protein